MIKMIRYSLYELRHSLIYKIGVFAVIPLILAPLAVYMDLAGLELKLILLYIVMGIFPAKLLFDLVYFKLRENTSRYNKPAQHKGESLMPKQGNKYEKST